MVASRCLGRTLDYIEKNLAGARVTEDGTTRFEKTGNVLAARFQHTTSRDLDPQTHTHLVLANATMSSAGQWRSLSNEAIYKSQTLLGKIYDTELAANLRAQGYRLEAGIEMALVHSQLRISANVTARFGLS